MDLSTIKRKLDTGQYQEPWQYVDDVWQMFNNAWLYNRKTSRVYKYCSKLAEVFEQEIDPVMQSLSYCCGRKVRTTDIQNRFCYTIIALNNNKCILNIAVYNGCTIISPQKKNQANNNNVQINAYFIYTSVIKGFTISL